MWCIGYSVELRAKKFRVKSSRGHVVHWLILGEAPRHSSWLSHRVVVKIMMYVALSPWRKSALLLFLLINADPAFQLAVYFAYVQRCLYWIASRSVWSIQTDSGSPKFPGQRFFHTPFTCEPLNEVAEDQTWDWLHTVEVLCYWASARPSSCRIPALNEFSIRQQCTNLTLSL